jgi:transposase-like protein
MTQWAQAIQDRLARGESIKVYCQNEGISKNTYFYRQRKLREAACVQVAMKQGEAAHRELPSHGFAEVQIAKPAALSESAQASPVHMEIGGARITFASSYPADKLAILLRELARPC